MGHRFISKECKDFADKVAEETGLQVYVLSTTQSFDHIVSYAEFAAANRIVYTTTKADTSGEGC
jgi:hypothetical protein